MRSSRKVGSAAALAVASLLSCIPPPGPIAAITAEPRIVPACAASRPERTDGRGAPSVTENVVLVTLDGVRWQEMFQGVDRTLATDARLPDAAVDAGDARSLVPNMHRLFFDEGTVLGAPGFGDGIAATGPRFVSLPAYLEIVTGTPSTCWTNDCNPDVPWTLVSEVAAAPDAPGVAVFASWERIERAVPSREGNVRLRAGRDPGDPAAAYPGSGRYLPDHWTMARSIEHLVRERPRFLWVALGDTDEWAHRGDYRGYLTALGRADAFVGELAAHLAEMGDYGARTSIIVTTDHGRDENFSDHGGRASAAVWLLARGGALEARGVVRTAAPRRLRDVAPTILTLLGRSLEPCVECGEPLRELL